METNGGCFLYFSYGSNLSSERIRLKNPSARFVDVAKLEDYKLCFRGYTENWCGSSASIEPAPGAHTWGVMWELKEEHMATLDAQEAVHEGVYRKMRVQVWPRESANPVEVLTYQHTEEKGLLPSKVYKEGLETMDTTGR
eukprot:GHVS01045279.1.p1 GENE.GHVS01045279.1~~GHVS01045279.1.p1  ORF type:complete len:140 (-),score=21.14 GHVS01045279.1:668-1087(-)